MDKKIPDLTVIQKRLLAKKLKLSYGHILNVLNGNKKISWKKAIEFEKATKGLVKREQLRPDIDWSTF